MRQWITAWIVLVGLVAVIAAAIGPAPVSAVDQPLTCIDCDGESCSPVQRSGAREGRCTPEGCVAWGECG